MATLFSDLYEELTMTEFFDRSFALETPVFQSKLLSLYMKRARSRFRDVANKNDGAIQLKMEDVVESAFSEYEFSTTGTTFVQVLSPAPVNGSSFYVTVNGVDFTSNTTYDENTDTITITGMPSTGTNNIEIDFYKDGQFNQTLNLVESDIVVDAMGIYYLKDKIKKDELLVIQVYGTDFKLHNQGNHIRALMDIYKESERQLDKRINRYSYRQSLDDFEGLVGDING